MGNNKSKSNRSEIFSQIRFLKNGPFSYNKEKNMERVFKITMATLGLVTASDNSSMVEHLTDTLSELKMAQVSQRGSGGRGGRGGRGSSEPAPAEPMPLPVPFVPPPVEEELVDEENKREGVVLPE